MTKDKREALYCNFSVISSLINLMSNKYELHLTNVYLISQKYMIRAINTHL
jgi:hypothetical protein